MGGVLFEFRDASVEDVLVELIKLDFQLKKINFLLLQIGPWSLMISPKIQSFHSWNMEGFHF